VAKLVVFSVAATLADLLTGATLGAIGSLLDVALRVGLATAFALVAIWTGAVETWGHRIRPLQCDRETPQSWMHSGPTRWALKNGAALGFGAGTRLGFSLWYVVPLGALLFGNVPVGAAIYGAYGGTRAVTAWLMIRAGSGRSFDDVAEWIFERASMARTVAAAVLLALGVATIVGVGL